VFAGPPVEVGVTMYVLSISSLSEVKMVQTNWTLYLSIIVKRSLAFYLYLSTPKSISLSLVFVVGVFFRILISFRTTKRISLLLSHTHTLTHTKSWFPNFHGTTNYQMFQLFCFVWTLSPNTILYIYIYIDRTIYYFLTVDQSTPVESVICESYPHPYLLCFLLFIWYYFLISYPFGTKSLKNSNSFECLVRFIAAVF